MGTIEVHGRLVLFDDADAEAVKAGRRWYLHPIGKTGRFYAFTHALAQGRKRKVYMHRAIMQPAPGYEVDHKNRDGLDNRRSNLRVCTHLENSRNRMPNNAPASGFRGVEKVCNLWSATIRVRGKNVRVRGFATPEAAAAAHDEMARRHFGEFAVLNFEVSK